MSEEAEGEEGENGAKGVERMESGRKIEIDKSG